MTADVAQGNLVNARIRLQELFVLLPAAEAERARMLLADVEDKVARLCARKILDRDPVEYALAGQHAGWDAARLCHEVEANTQESAPDTFPMMVRLMDGPAGGEHVQVWFTGPPDDLRPTVRSLVFVVPGGGNAAEASPALQFLRSSVVYDLVQQPSGAWVGRYCGANDGR